MHQQIELLAVEQAFPSRIGLVDRLQLAEKWLPPPIVPSASG
ncbi:hypothetical protein ACFSQT_29650 [Mesorhizobium calcicola]|uniref:Uncharacterized protein n=1 Tax=Mesorhizobium calcicola TaxID=1300310 RepID=A0ABW4WKL8_9HYPH